MATISSAGLGSGLDVTSIVSQLMAIEKQPLTKMQSAASKIDTKISAYGKVQSYVSSLRDAAAKLAKASTWGSTTSASSDASVVTASSSSTSAQAGNYSVKVNALAASQTLASAGFGASTTTVGSGTLQIQLGTWSGGDPPTAFTAKSGSTAASLTIAATDTLADIRDKINNAGAGVTASILTDASGARLVMRSSETGEANGFRVQAADDDGSNTNAAGLSALAYDPPGSAAAMTRTQTASNAQAEINGLAVSSTSNTLTTAVDGVSLKLNKVSSSAVDVSVSSDTSTIKAALTDFAKAYNDLANYLTDQTKYDSTTKVAGTFQGDAAMNALRAGLRALGTGSGGTSTVMSRLASIGFDPQADGSLKTNTAKLDAALASPAELKKMFVTSGSTDGMGAKIRQWADTLLGSDGAISSRQGSLQTQKTNNTKAQDKFNDHLTQTEARLKAQYTALDSTMSKINGLSSYVTQQLKALSSSSN